MTGNLPGFFQGTEMPSAGWWEALWPNPAEVLAAVGVRAGIELSRFHLANQRIGFLRFAAGTDSQGVWHGGKVSGYRER